MEPFMKKALIIITCIVLVLALLGGAAWYFLVYQNNMTAERCADLAAQSANSGKFSRAIQLYTTAYELDPANYDLAISLADTYAASGNYTKAEYTLVNAIADHPNAADLYLALSRTYVAQDKLLDAQLMLDNIGNTEVKAVLEPMRPAAPTLSPESGYYSDYISVSLTYGSGTAYLRVDGEYPSTGDAPYSQPIALEGGETEASAIVVGENGLVSPVTYGGYTIGNIVEEVTFASSAFEHFARETLELDPAKPVMTDDLWTVTELTVPETLTDLADLSYFTGLTSLTLQNYHGGEFDFLSGMTQLATLDLSRSSVSTLALEFIGTLQSIKTLNLESCGVTDITSLGALSSLESLNLNGNKVATIAPLANCTNLRTLHLSSNSITDISTFASLKGLVELDLSYNTPTTLAPLGQCPNLQVLNLSYCSLLDISVLKNCPELTHLNASHNTLTGISGLEACTKLQEVDLSYNKLVSIDELGPIDSITLVNINENDVVSLPPFTENSSLQRFYADHNFLEDVSGLASLPYLNYVTLDYNNINDIDCLADCVNLVQVNVFHTNIGTEEEVAALTERSIIVNYTPDY